MKKIINGLRYDTDTAILIGEASSKGVSRSDFKFWEAGLYVTKRSRRFFLAGEGGPMTRFAQSTGQNSWTGGSDLIPMSEKEAQAWAEQNLEDGDIAHYFVIEEA